MKATKEDPFQLVGCDAGLISRKYIRKCLDVFSVLTPIHHFAANGFTAYIGIVLVDADRDLLLSLKYLLFGYGDQT